MAAHRDAALTSFSPSIPSYFPKCSLKCDELLYHKSFNAPLHFLKLQSNTGLNRISQALT